MVAIYLTCCGVEKILGRTISSITENVYHNMLYHVKGKLNL